ncbi:MAG: twin-arginine translocase subunit TatC [Acidimicrobiaceae bacterium]|nr:twin-arginine translocase subunit TatC [Acidimicrobiaceae bacterium]
MAVTDETHASADDDRAVGRMSLVEHLAELRKRLLITLIAVAATTIVAWIFYNHIITFMLQPYHGYLHTHHQKDISNGNLIITGPLEGFTTRLKISIYTGIALATPILLHQTWRFITPALHKNERRYLLPFLTAGIALFTLGATTAILVFPKALTWLINASGTGIVPLFTPTRYLTFYAAMVVITGATFTYPLVIVLLELTGTIPTTTWRHWRRQAIVILCLTAAVITPSNDPFSFLAMAIPMLILYETAILTGRALHK